MTNQYQAWHPKNISPTQPQLPQLPTKTPFTLTTPPNKTDIWRPTLQPTDDVFNAPYLHLKTRRQNFRRMAVTFSANWKTLYDQGGICLTVPSAKGSGELQDAKWLKSGLEFYEGRAALSTVVADRVSDWSLCPLPGSSETASGGVSATVEVVDLGEKVVVNALLEDGGKVVLREVPWILLAGDEGAVGEVWIGVYVAKPTADEGGWEAGGLEVRFEGLEIEVMEG
ncbi:hypothetical protein MBLNU230_g5375t1 [Neophaeotheca triangularis]